MALKNKDFPVLAGLEHCGVMDTWGNLFEVASCTVCNPQNFLVLSILDLKA